MAVGLADLLQVVDGAKCGEGLTNYKIWGWSAPFWPKCIDFNLNIIYFSHFFIGKICGALVKDYGESIRKKEVMVSMPIILIFYQKIS